MWMHIICRWRVSPTGSFYFPFCVVLANLKRRKDPVPGVPGKLASIFLFGKSLTWTEQVLGYEHPSGEIHIQAGVHPCCHELCGWYIRLQDTGTWNLCPGTSESFDTRSILTLSTGQDNGSALCSVGEVADLFEGSVSDHDGPYDGVRMGGCWYSVLLSVSCLFCSCTNDCIFTIHCLHRAQKSLDADAKFDAQQFVANRSLWNLGEILLWPIELYYRRNRGQKRSGTAVGCEGVTNQRRADDCDILWQSVKIIRRSHSPSILVLNFFYHVYLCREINNSKSDKNRPTTKHSATNFALGSVVLMARARISVNTHPFSLEVFGFLMNTHLSVEFEPLPKAIGQELSSSECILHF
jgi:hypothetical protein